MIRIFKVELIIFLLLYFILFFIVIHNSWNYIPILLIRSWFNKFQLLHLLLKMLTLVLTLQHTLPSGYLLTSFYPLLPVDPILGP